jgi:universal stress protein A
MLAVRTILHPNDFSGYSAEAFQFAYALARDYHARLVVLHVAPPPSVTWGDFLTTDAKEYRRALEDNVVRLQGKGFPVDIDYVISAGDPAAIILDQAKAAKADLIVMGTHGRTGLNRVLMGSVAERVVRRASCAVLTLKQPATAPAAIEKPVESEHETLVPIF